MAGAGIPVFGHALGFVCIIAFAFVLNASGAGRRESAWLSLVSLTIAFLPTTVPLGAVPAAVRIIWPWKYPPWPSQIELLGSGPVLLTIDILLIVATVWLGRLIYSPFGQQIHNDRADALVRAVQSYGDANDGRLPNLSSWAAARADILPYIPDGWRSDFPTDLNMVTNSSISGKAFQSLSPAVNEFIFAFPADKDKYRVTVYADHQVRNLSGWAWRAVVRRLEKSGRFNGFSPFLQ